MALSTRDNTKRRKRPPEAGTLVGVRLQPDLLAKIDELRAQHPGTSRPEAIRQVLAATFKMMNDAD